MTSKIIEYDLKKPGRNYDAVYEIIKSYPVWAHITKSTWFVKTSDTCAISGLNGNNFLTTPNCLGKMSDTHSVSFKPT